MHIQICAACVQLGISPSENMCIFLCHCWQNSSEENYNHVQGEQMLNNLQTHNQEDAWKITYAGNKTNSTNSKRMFLFLSLPIFFTTFTKCNFDSHLTQLFFFCFVFKFSKFLEKNQYMLVCNNYTFKVISWLRIFKKTKQNMTPFIPIQYHTCAWVFSSIAAQFK